MSTSIRFGRAAMLVAGIIALTASHAGAQRRVPRMGVAAPPPPPQSSLPRIQSAAGRNGVVDPRFPAGDPRFRTNDRFNRRGFQHQRGSSIVYVPYAVGGFGYYDGYYSSYAPGQVYDANGRPLYTPYENQPAPAAAVYGGYTPDLTGAPYTVSDEGMMVVDFPNGERRAFPSCAAQGDLRDPQGRPRTIFYQQSDYWMVLRPGQTGRVHGEPAVNAKACYAIDSTGRVVLRE